MGDIATVTLLRHPRFICFNIFAICLKFFLVLALVHVRASALISTVGSPNAYDYTCLPELALWL